MSNAPVAPNLGADESFGISDGDSVGARLRRAREAAGLSAVDIADVLRFGVRQIEALEADRYELLAGATLVRGMVRGYAKYLHLDVDALLRQLEFKVPRPQSDVRPPTNIGEAADTSELPTVSVRSIALALTIAVCIGLGVYLTGDWVYWGERGDSLTVVGRSPAQPSGGAAPTADLPASSSGLISGTDRGDVPVVGQGAGIPAGLAQPAAIAANAQTPLEASVSQSTTEAAAKVPEPSADGLVLDFDGHSWVEVRDGTQTIVLSGEFGKGTQKSVSGRGPYQLWIGRASVVRVSYRGKPIDIRSRTREDVARLTVDAQDS